MSRNEPQDSDTPPPLPEPPPAGGSARFTPAEIAGINTPLIGRDSELQRLVGELYTVLEGGEPRIVTVVGPAGIGKSRLAHELRQLVGRLPEPVSLVTLQADRQSTGQPYSLIRMLVAALFRIREGDAPTTVRARLEQGVSLVLGSDSEEKAHFIGQLAGYDFSGSPHLRGPLAEPRQVRDRALHYAAQCLQAFTAQAPIVLLVDDFHHADDSSIDAMAQVLRGSGDLSLLVICLAQQRLYERRPDWDRALGALGVRLDLSPLDERDGRRLVAEILRKAGKLPVDLRNLIVSRAEGNPFYVEELIKMLIADGVIVPGPATWTVQQGRLSRLRIPATLGELLRARMQALAPTERELLVRAAVVGRFFWAEAAAQINGASGEEGEPVAALLDSLEQKALIAPLPESRFAGQREYAFRHELLHEVAYNQVAPELRELYHRRVADWLICSSGERAGAYAGLIAEHYERGGSPEQAAGWYVRAGHHALETYAIDTAIQRYQMALAHLPEDAAAERAATYAGLGQAQLSIARLGDAVACYTRMAELAEAAGDRVTAARGWNGRAFVQDHALEFADAKESALRGIAHAEAAGAAGELALGLFHLAWAEIRLDNPQTALELGQRAQAILATADEPATAARWSGLLGVIHDQLGDHGRAVHFQQEALAYYRQAAKLSEVATQLNNLGATANTLGDFSLALGYLREALQVSGAIGSRVLEIYVLSNLGHTLNGLGDHLGAEEAARRGVELSELSRMPVFADFYTALAEACLRQERVTEAVEAAQQALDLARANEGAREVAAAWRALGHTIGAMSDSQGAPRCFEESARIFAANGARAELARTLRTWAEHELRGGDVERGRQLAEQARGIFAELGLARELERTRPVER